MKEYGEELIRIENMAKVYDTGALKVLGLKRINLTIRQGEFVAIMGQSGSGKINIDEYSWLSGSAFSGTLLSGRSRCGRNDLG